ncbi:NADP-dependent oxidoreductase [Streptomyces sp. NBC_01298]|uniref:NADP-dependent oxidoreductase n=1 Tax=Streptomyces sp. NBC_01298 TaxID=2903817 RepID=UPI002E142098|nr:NADP-dependent oxidoreductase [Streptomyces sp. NBC_01298]
MNATRQPAATMLAARIHAYGGPAVIRHEEVPVPVPAPGEVLVEVAATSFNPSELALRAGWLRDVLPLDLPYVPGWDLAGTVVTTGERVIGRLDAGGTAAPYVSVAPGLLVPAPRSLPLTAAAAIPVAGLTAWQALFEAAGIGPGSRILINGAGGGVGAFAVQLARWAGATVVATASPRSALAVRRYGARRVIDHTAGPLSTALEGEPLDAVLNLAPIAPEAAAALPALLGPGGVAVSVATPIPGGIHLVARQDTGQLARLVELVDAGDLEVAPAAVRPLADLADVHAEAEAGTLVRGKTVLVPDASRRASL